MVMMLYYTILVTCGKNNSGKRSIINMKFVIVTALELSWFVLPRGLVGGYQYIGGTYCLHLQDNAKVHHQYSESCWTLKNRGLR
jgi:hypothetical protein